MKASTHLKLMRDNYKVELEQLTIREHEIAVRRTTLQSVVSDLTDVIMELEKEESQ
jgi:hypothetical protein